MTETIFTTRENLAGTIRARFIVDGISAYTAMAIEDAIQSLESEARKNGAEGAEIRSDFLDVRVILTAYADLARRDVKIGAAFLDSIRDDDWRAQINRETLDILSPTWCLLGQLYGGYHVGVDAVIRIANDREIEPSRRPWRAFYGCSMSNPLACCGDGATPASLLTLAWLELLNA